MDFQGDLDLITKENTKWLKSIWLWNFANLSWAKHCQNIYAPIQLSFFQSLKKLIGTEIEITWEYFAHNSKLPMDVISNQEKASKGVLKKEFGQPEGKRSYYV